ncbi:MAG: hypothetical protein JW829_05540 [Pirellulales bacterium]|nr:hypothetical protein [Pirellulales bacterium]
MTPPSMDATAPIRKAVYGILIALAVGHMIGRILAVNSVNLENLEKHRIDQRLDETRQELVARGMEGEALEQQLAKRRDELTQKLRLQRPFLSSNDRSRWATVRSLVELGTYEIEKIITEPTWDTIDMVSHKGRDGVKHIYSSKPPLLATLIAGEYWLVHKATGGKMTLGSHPHELGRFFLITLNVPLFFIMFVLVARITDRLGGTNFGRLFVMATATFGTLLTSFAIALNNHLFAATSITVALYTTLRIVCDGEERGRYFLLAGLAGAFAVACEPPALSFFAVQLAVLLWRAPRGTSIWFAPSALVVVAAFFGTNYLAHNTFSIPYAHRHSKTTPAATTDAEQPPPIEGGINEEDNWYVFTYEQNGKIRQSYWSNPTGIDRGEPDQGIYALHVLVGHHGIFSLTPVWLLSVLGAAIWLVGKGSPSMPSAPVRKSIPRDRAQEGNQIQETDPGSSSNGGDRSAIRERQFIAFTTLLLTAVCVVYFIYFRPAQDRNYGGMTNGFRWLFWLIPLWLVTMLPAADWMGRHRWTRGIAFLLLALSVLSAAYATWNPWSQPWLARWMESMGWVTFG